MNKEINSNINDEKKIINEGFANHFKGMESVGGKLYLTSDEVIFKSHALNIQTHIAIIPLNKIVEVKTRLTAGFIPNGLEIRTNDGVIEKFVVYHRKTWVKKINDAISMLHN